MEAIRPPEGGIAMAAHSQKSVTIQDVAKYAGVWGIDIGQAAFKALRCTLQDGEIVEDKLIG